MHTNTISVPMMAFMAFTGEYSGSTHASTAISCVMTCITRRVLFVLLVRHTCTLLAAPTQTANAIKHVATTTANACICGDECIRSLIVVIVPFAILIAK
jgi:hypothetical protein